MNVLVCVLAVLAAVGAAPGGRIIGGWDAVRGQFPHQVSAQYCRGQTCSHSCGGVILSDIWILTAAHCITDVSGGEYRIVAGILYLNDTNSQRQDVRVAQSLVHPDYQGGVGPHDIGLWRLERPLDLSDQVFPALLPAEGHITGPEVELSGWGSIGTNIIFPIMPNTMQTVSIPLVSQVECDAALSAILEGRPHPLDLDNNICTGPLDQSISACSGDSGGPLVENGRTVVGIVSWGITPCGTIGAPSVYVKVSRYIQWITYHIYEPEKKLE